MNKQWIVVASVVAVVVAFVAGAVVFKGRETLKILRSGTSIDVPAIKVETTKGHQYWVYEDSADPIILKMKGPYEMVLKELK